MLGISYAERRLHTFLVFTGLKTQASSWYPIKTCNCLLNICSFQSALLVRSELVRHEWVVCGIPVQQISRITSISSRALAQASLGFAVRLIKKLRNLSLPKCRRFDTPRGPTAEGQAAIPCKRHHGWPSQLLHLPDQREGPEGEHLRPSALLTTQMVGASSNVAVSRMFWHIPASAVDWSLLLMT